LLQTGIPHERHDSRIKGWASRLKSETYAVYLAYRDPRTPWYAKVLAALVVGYAFSPIDLIPDFIPVLGYLDDLLIVPAGLAIAIKLIPQDVLAECRARAEQEGAGRKPVNRGVAVVVVCIWLALLALAVFLVFRAF
jgi:uncharacterized membrane protein YkvA (DUF1232 family)